MQRLALLSGFDAAERLRLQQLASIVVRDKAFSGVGGLDLEPSIIATTALQIALPLLNLGDEGLAGWHEVILYPAPFIVDHEEADEAGVVHRIHEARSGESWLHGPLVLAWSDVAEGGRIDGYNVVIHEMAHKLDGLDGSLDGMPPLHADMCANTWQREWASAYAALQILEQRSHHGIIDPYALESPAECFAVFSETFFELPHALCHAFPQVYDQLVAFYRQDPASRLAS